MYSRTLLRKIIMVNIFLVLAIGLYGDVTDEPLSREIGHGEWLYDYLWWFALAVNGLSGYAAASLSGLFVPGSSSSDLDLRYFLQYALWLPLLALQWRGYHAAAVWSYGHRRREIALYIAGVSMTLLGCFAAYQMWTVCLEIGEFRNFTSCYFTFLGMAGLPLSGLILIAYSRFGRTGKPPA